MKKVRARHQQGTKKALEKAPTAPTRHQARTEKAPERAPTRHQEGTKKTPKGTNKTPEKAPGRDQQASTNTQETVPKNSRNALWHTFSQLPFVFSSAGFALLCHGMLFLGFCLLFCVFLAFVLLLGLFSCCFLVCGRLWSDLGVFALAVQKDATKA